MNVKSFLNLIGSTLRKDRPLVPNNYNYTIKDYGGFIHFWFRTQGCKYTKGKNGGCLMCDYSSSKQENVDKMKQYILEGLRKIDNPKFILLNSSGSFLDDNEVPREVRITIYKELSKYLDLEIILETLLETVDNKKLEEIREILKYQILDIEFGIESMDNRILKYCINKNIDIKTLPDKIDLIKKYDMNAVANIIVGIPFISEKENIEMALKSIYKLFDTGIDYVVLFPINIKPFTTIHWLNKNGLYEPISLWSYIEVLKRIDKKYLSKIELSWYRDTSKSPIYKDGVKAPTTCPKCQDKVLLLLDKFTQTSESRVKILDELDQIQCDCKIKYQEKLLKDSNLEDNILFSFRKMANDILGKDFWLRYGNKIEKEIKDDFKSL